MNKVSNDNCPVNEPSGPDFVSHYIKLDHPQWRDNFDDASEHKAIPIICGMNMEHDIIYSKFTNKEKESCIDFLKNNKAPGVDGIPAEIIKHCKQYLLFHYIAEQRDIPEVWAEGLRSTIFKFGNSGVTDNHWGMTVLPIIEIFLRLQFTDTSAFGKIDTNNGGFLQGRGTADNIFVLPCLFKDKLS